MAGEYSPHKDDTNFTTSKLEDDTSNPGLDKKSIETQKYRDFIETLISDIGELYTIQELLSFRANIIMEKAKGEIGDDDFSYLLVIIEKRKVRIQEITADWFESAIRGADNLPRLAALEVAAELKDRDGGLPENYLEEKLKPLFKSKEEVHLKEQEGELRS